MLVHESFSVLLYNWSKEFPSSISYDTPMGCSSDTLILELYNKPYWVLVILYLILFMAIDKHDQSAGVCK